MRLVIDTNIWVSGLLWRGLPWKLLRLAERGEVELCMAPTMLIELDKVLCYERLQPRLNKLELTSSELVAYVVSLVSIFEVPEGDPVVAADRDDDVFLWCAVVANALYVVSGDHHLLDLGEHAGIPILTIREFFVREFPEHVD